jgi:hypothetical protein
VVEHGDGSTNEGPHPEHPLVLPNLSLVDDDGRPQAPGRVDAGASDGDGGEVHHEHSEADRQRRHHWNMLISGLALCVVGGENGVHEHEGAHDLRDQPPGPGVAGGDHVGTATVKLVGARAVYSPHEAGAADGAHALRHRVQRRLRQRHLAGKQRAERDGRVDVQ